MIGLNITVIIAPLIRIMPYIDRKHLIHVGCFNGNYYVQDVASLNEDGGLL